MAPRFASTANRHRRLTASDQRLTDQRLLLTSDQRPATSDQRLTIMWIFGYGSLIWKPGFDWIDRQIGFVRGWKRRFFQGSYDHRGIPGEPGRVVTLLPDQSALTWGVVFRIEGDEKERVVRRLDHREKGGYERHRIPVFDRRKGEVTRVVDEALMYVATEDNPNYLGYASAAEIARQARTARGPSGPNAEYVLNLADSLRNFGVDDDHVFAVDRALRAMLDDG